MQQNNDYELEKLELEELELFREFLSRKYGWNVARRLREGLNKKNEDVKNNE